VVGGAWGGERGATFAPRDVSCDKGLCTAKLPPHGVRYGRMWCRGIWGQILYRVVTIQHRISINHHHHTMSAQVEEKPELSQLEVAMDLGRVDNEGYFSPAHMGDGLVKSRFDDLSLGKACWTFRKALFYCFVAYTSSVMEGFVVRTRGSDQRRRA
jgi:hypothetical protein